MSWSAKDAREWQKRLAAAPKVYVVVDRYGEFENVYDSREAAELEVRFMGRRTFGSCRIREVPVQPLQLAKERWGDG